MLDPGDGIAWRGSFDAAAMMSNLTATIGRVCARMSEHTRT
ncbi:hypothetical protein [Pseudoclavibacter sp. CFCC 13796]|nr:hypothetical protein [Pseudoclavibacter sp. CFCC 13796]